MSYSVLMSVYAGEREEYLRAAAESMFRQTVPPGEVVLVCDGPLTPGLEAEIARLEGECPCPMKLVRLPVCGGLGNALRQGTEQCAFPVVARMDTDDLAVENRMELQLARLAECPGLSALGGQIAEFQTDPSRVVAYRRVPCSSADIRAFAARRNPMNHMTVTFRREDVLSAGGYRSFEKFEDYDLWARMLAQGFLLENLDAVLVCARVSADTYHRRGGLAYFRQTIRMQKQLLQSGLIGVPGFCRNVLVRFAGTVLLPNRLRGALYRRHLRERSGTEGQTP